MNILNAEDLITLSIFQCRICNCRLQYPIMKDIHGNSCAGCYKNGDQSVAAVENIQLGMLMKKLYFPCHYGIEGCTYFGPFLKTCQHEKCCPNREILCPFIHQEACRNVIRVSNIMSHIREKHNDKIIVVKDNCLTVKNPTKSHPESFYFFIVDGNDFIVRVVYDIGTNKILYAFYRFSDFGPARSVRFTSDAFTSTDFKVRVMHESELDETLNDKNVFVADLKVLIDLQYSNEIKINIFNSVVVQEKDPGMLMTKMRWSQCKYCYNVVERLHICKNCCITVSCDSCAKNCQKCGKYSQETIDISELQIDSVFPCQAAACKQFIRGDMYDLHKRFQCRFTQLACTICRLKLNGDLMPAHIVKEHTNKINANTCSLKISEGHTQIFSNDSDVFVLEYSLSLEEKLHASMVKITEPFWDDSYLWEIHLKKPRTSSGLVVYNECTMNGTKLVQDVLKFIDKDILTFEVYVKRI